MVRQRLGPPGDVVVLDDRDRLRPVFQGRGIGTEAQRLVVDYLFAHTRHDRIQAWTDIANRAEQRALEKAGFIREGVVREAQWRGGAGHDLVLYSVLRAEAAGAPPPVRPAP